METKDRYIKTRKVYTARDLEKKIESKFRDRIKELGGVAYKFVSPGNSRCTRQTCNTSRWKSRICRT